MTPALRNILLGLLGILSVLSLFLATRYEAPGPALGRATPGLYPGTTTPLSYYNGDVSASSTVGIMFQAIPNCLARIVTTASGTIRIGMTSTTPSAVIGVFQAASSSVIYDSDQYGCGTWTVFGYSPIGVQGGATAHTIHIFETR